jgi:hypothetical protein
MTQQTFNVLHHYTEKLTRDPDDRDELVLMAWQESLKLKERSNIPLMINHMKLRALEIGKRCALGAKISGKSQRDALNHERISLSQPYLGQADCTLEDTLVSYGQSPLNICIVDDFNSALTPDEQTFTDAIVAGYNSQEIQKLMGIGYLRFKELKLKVREKAVAYLV